MKARTILKFVAIAGVPITGYLSARGALKCEQIIRKEGIAVSRKEKAKDVVRAYWPAMASGAVTVCSILVSDGLASKEIAAATAIATAAVAKKDLLKQQFEKYRRVVKDEDGDERDIDILSKASAVRYDEDGEAVHRFRIDWMNEPIFIEGTMIDIITGLNAVNRRLFDYSTGSGVVTVSDALKLLKHEELINSKTDKAGWCSDILIYGCDSYWLDFYMYRETEGFTSHGDEDPNLYIIDVAWPPEENLEKSLMEGEREGWL